MVSTMGSLMETLLEDGEDPMVITNDYIDVLCQVTSTTGALDFESGEWRCLSRGQARGNHVEGNENKKREP